MAVVANHGTVGRFGYAEQGAGFFLGCTFEAPLRYSDAAVAGEVGRSRNWPVSSVAR